MITVHHKNMSEYSAKEVSIENAIQNSINDAVGYYSGISKTLEEKTNKQSEMLGKLIELLVKKGLMTADELDQFLSYNYEASE